MNSRLAHHLSTTTIWARCNVMPSVTPLSLSSNQNLQVRIGRKGLLRRSVHSSPLHAPGQPQTQNGTNKMALPKLVIFHNPLSEFSCKLVKEINDARAAWPLRTAKKPAGPPLEFELTVETRLPTVEEFRDMYDLLDASSWTIFFNPQLGWEGNYRTHPTGARSLLEAINFIQAQQREHVCRDLAQSPDPLHDPDHPLFGTQQFAWPAIVCWDARLVALGIHGTKGVRRILKALASMRDRAANLATAEVEEEKKKGEVGKYNSLPKEVSPPEDETLRWFKETSQGSRTRRPPSWGLRSD